MKSKMMKKANRKLRKAKMKGNLLMEMAEDFKAETTLVCRKIYCQDLDLEQIPQEVRDAFYKDEPVHRMYIGEVVEIIEG